MAADAHKWMLGPCGAGLFYVRKDWQEKLRPAVLGWNNVRCPGFVASEIMEYRSGARRYEAGSYNWLGIAGMKAGMDLLLEAGVGEIAKELLRKRSVMVSGLLERGCEVLEPGMEPRNASGIVSVRRGQDAMAPLHASLEASGVITSLRVNPAGVQWIRLSPHFYNADADLDRLFECLKAAE